ncbi:MAG: sensor histidine kinase, partial [Anaerostipes hadrus]
EYQLRETLYEQLDQVQKESLAKTDFLSRMSHEIRTPMNGILGMLNLAQKHIDDSTLVSQYLGKTENLSMFLLTLINDILDMSRIESGKMKLEEVPFDLTVMAAKIDNMFSGSAKERDFMDTAITEY